MNNRPCLDCNDRTIICHDTCHEYKEFRKVIDNIKLCRKRELDADGYVVNNIHKFKKMRNLPQYR